MVEHERFTVITNMQAAALEATVTCKGMTVSSAERVKAHTYRLSTPRNSRYHPEQMEEAQRYVHDHFVNHGWSVTHQQVDVPWVLGIDDRANRSAAQAVRLQIRRPGVNILATNMPDSDLPPVIVVAHLDAVGYSAGANDNASGVAVVLEVAQQLQHVITSRPVMLAVVDLEEAGKIGSKMLAGSLPGKAKFVINLDGVGYFDDRPNTQKMPLPLRRLDRAAARIVEENSYRGNYIGVLYRRGSWNAVEQWSAHSFMQDRPLLTVPMYDPRPYGWQNQAVTWLRPSLIWTVVTITGSHGRASRPSS